MTQSCCSLGSPEPPRASGSRRQCFLCGAAPLRRSPWPRRACKRLRWPLRAWPWCQQPAACGGPTRTHVAGTGEPHAQHARRSRSAARRGRLPLENEHVRPLRLGAAPEQRIPIYLAALAPSSVRLAGELADHWLPFLWARSRLGDGRALLAEGEAAGERRARPASPRASRSRSAQDDETARQIAAGWLLAYLTRMGPIYPRMLRDQFGFAREVDILLEANGSAGPPRLPSAAERLARRRSR